MTRALTVFGFAIVVACGGSGEASTPGAPPALALAVVAAASAQQSAQHEPAQQQVMTRRVWGPGATGFVSPSPDGKFVAFVDWETGDVALRDLEAQQTRRLTRQPQAYGGYALFLAYSPDGTRIAFNWQDVESRPPRFDLRVIGVAGGEPRVLDRIPATSWIMPGDWSPDGKHILALRTRDDGTNEILLVAAADGSSTVLKTLDWRAPHQLRFSPDGRYIAYDFPQAEDADQRDIFVLATDGSRETRITRSTANDHFLDWTPDGQHILFLSDRSGTPSAWLQRLSDGNASGLPVLAKADLWNAHPGGFARDGRYFYTIEIGTHSLYTATLGEAGRSVLAPPARIKSRVEGEMRVPSWSPDGRYVSYVRFAQPITTSGRRPTVVIRSMDTGEERELHLDRAVEYVRRLSWTPDTRSLLASGTDDRGRIAVWRIDARTGHIETLLENESAEGFSRDGRFLFVVRRDSADEKAQAPGRDRLVVRDLAIGIERTVFTGDAGAALVAVALSPDDRSLALAYRRPQAGNVIALLPADGGTPRTVVELGSRRPYSLTWAPDGRALYFPLPPEPGSTDGRRRLFRVEVTGGSPVDVGLAMKVLGTYGAPSFHPDGRQLVFSAGSPDFELWVMEGLLPTPDSAARHSR